MQVTISQFNTVVAGLRQHNALLAEQNHSVIENNKFLRGEVNHLGELLRREEEENKLLQRQLAACQLAAHGAEDAEPCLKTPAWLAVRGLFVGSKAWLGLVTSLRTEIADLQRQLASAKRQRKR